MIWSWFSFVAGIGFAAAVCVVVGLAITLWRNRERGSKTMKQVAWQLVSRLHKFLAECPMTQNHAWRGIWRIQRWLRETGAQQ